MIIIKDVKTTSNETTHLYTVIIQYIENGQEFERITSAQTIIELFNTLRDLNKADSDV